MFVAHFYPIYLALTILSEAHVYSTDHIYFSLFPLSLLFFLISCRVLVYCFPFAFQESARATKKKIKKFHHISCFSNRFLYYISKQKKVLQQNMVDSASLCLTHWRQKTWTRDLLLQTLPLNVRCLPSLTFGLFTLQSKQQSNNGINAAVILTYYSFMFCQQWDYVRNIQAKCQLSTSKAEAVLLLPSLEMNWDYITFSNPRVNHLSKLRCVLYYFICCPDSSLYLKCPPCDHHFQPCKWCNHIAQI